MSAHQLGWLVDMEALRRLPQLYSRAIDARDFERVSALFHPDATVDGARGSMAASDWVEGLRAAPSAFAQSMHVLGDPLIDLEPGADRATLDTYATVYQLRDQGEVDPELLLGIRYTDEVVRHEGSWLISRRTSTMLWNRNLPGVG